MANHRQILVDGSPVGLVGLDQVFAELKAAGHQPGEAELGRILTAAVERDNYIPYGARERYTAALLQAYAAHVSGNGTAAASPDDGHGMWRGLPREQVPWYPTVDEDLCDGCGLCLRMCQKGALVAAPDGKARVGDPFACIVGCNACANLCKPGAILFPPRSILDTVVNNGHHTASRTYGGR